MIAGPNGSGKSTLRLLLKPEWLGEYVNPDELELDLLSSDGLNLRKLFELDAEPFLQYVRTAYIGTADLGLVLQSISFERDVLRCSVPELASHLASPLSSFVRNSLREGGVSHTFETVMSSRDKVEYLCRSREMGFRTYLYYIATEDPLINQSRIEHRVLAGGHSVPAAKVASRYSRSLSLLLDAMECSDRAFFLDNSGSEARLVAEWDGHNLSVAADPPGWFGQYVLSKLPGT